MTLDDFISFWMLIIHPIFIYSHQCKLPYTKPWWSRVELNHCLWIFSPLYNNHLYDSSIIVEHYILFTLSMHHFNLIEPLSSPCLILQQESLSGSVSLYMMCWLDLPFTSLYWVTESNRHQMLERHLASTISRLTQHLFSTAKITKIFETSKSFCIF